MEWARFDPSLLTIPTRTLARLQTHMRHHGVPGSVILSACLEFAAPRMTPSFVDTFFRQYCAVVQDPTRPAQVERLRPDWAKKGTNRYRRAVTASQEVS